MAAVACAAALLFSLAGCAGQPTPQPTSAQPTVAPVFDSDEEALAAATEAYANYLKLSNEIAHDGGNHAERISEVATGEAMETEIRSLEGMRSAGTVGVGDVGFDNFTLQSTDLSSGSVIAYVCLDVSGADVVDAAGTSVLPPDRVESLPLEIGFIFQTSLKRLLLERTQVWDGENFCSPP
jgi:hypothetical protein